MKRMKKKPIICMLLFVMLAVLTLSGCQGKEEQQSDTVVRFSTGEEELLSIGATKCPVSYAKVLLCNYQNLYGRAFGVDLWAHDFGEQDLYSYVKEVSLTELARLITMESLAESRGLSLSAKEIESAQTAAQTYYASLSDAEKEYMGINEEGLAALYRDYALAKKLYSQLTAGVNYEVSEDEARVMTVQEILVTEDTQAMEIQNALANDTDFATLAAQYTEGEQIEKNIKRGDLALPVENAAYALDTGEISEAVKADDGWHFIKCINKNVEDLTAENKLVIGQKREKEASDDIYEAYVKDLPSTLNQDLWDAVDLKTDGSITTDSFFSVYEQCF